MKTSGIVLKPRIYRTAVAPPAVLEDTSRFKNNGVFHNSVFWNRTSSGLWMLEFDPATSDYVTVANFRMPVSATIEIAIIPDFAWDVAIYRYFFEWRGNANNYIQAYKATVPEGNDICLCGKVAGDSWNASHEYHFPSGEPLIIHCVMDSTGNGYLYINGAFEASDTFVGTLADLAATLYIGASDTLTEFFDGKLFLPRIYNYALSAAQIYSIYQAERSLFGV